MILLGYLLVAGLGGICLGCALAVLRRAVADRPSDGEVWHEMWTPRGRRWMP